MKILSFRISSAFAAFRDPSVTSNQTVYYIPSKSAIVGLVGALIGIRRSDSLGVIYGNEYLDFFEKTRIGIKLESTPKKTTYFTNHRSLKKSKTKPFKTELVENPRYTFYISTEDSLMKRLSDALSKNEFSYAPYLGHAYCPASIFDSKEMEGREADSEGERTTCVILDESESYNPNFEFKPEIVSGGSVIIERHIHHFFKDAKFDGRVLKHWIPTNGTELEIIRDSPRDLSKIYKVGDQVVCLY